MSLDPETKLVSEALVASGVLVENYNLTNLTLTKQIYNRCVKDPTYCRLQAAKWFQERAPKRKGVIYPTRFASYDLEDLWDVSPFHYQKTTIYRIVSKNPELADWKHIDFTTDFVKSSKDNFPFCRKSMNKFSNGALNASSMNFASSFNASIIAVI